MAIEKLEKEVSEQDFIAAVSIAATKLGFEVENWNITKPGELNDEKYKIQKFYHQEHKYGEGGYRQTDMVLWKVIVREDKVLEARNCVSWYTYSDDSADFPEKPKYELTLYQDDKLAKAVFERLKEKDKIKK